MSYILLLFVYLSVQKLVLDLGKNYYNTFVLYVFCTFKQNTLAQYCYIALRLYFFLLETGKVFIRSERVILSRFSTQTLQLGIVGDLIKLKLTLTVTA